MELARGSWGMCLLRARRLLAGVVSVSLTLCRCQVHAFPPLVEGEIPWDAGQELDLQIDGEETERTLYFSGWRWLWERWWWRWQTKCCVVGEVRKNEGEESEQRARDQTAVRWGRWPLG
ncbi:hypothetical protein QBC39DRAFT_360862 [Podospora conica]|nr:hypothetical protein QBC39DRAFT_360862 [Schizothecium conicum]